MKKTLITILALILIFLVGSQVANALGTLTPAGAPGSATQYTLNDIYTKLTVNSSTSTKSGLFSTPGSVNVSFRTLAEIYAAIPTIDATKVATGTTYLGVVGTLQPSVPPLQWSAEQQLENWSDATSACAALTEGGVTAGTWRLPTLSELLSGFVDDWILEGDATGERFSGDSTYYWSGTASGGGGIWIVYWDGNRAYMSETSPGSSYISRCVR